MTVRAQMANFQIRHIPMHYLLPKVTLIIIVKINSEFIISELQSNNFKRNPQMCCP